MPLAKLVELYKRSFGIESGQTEIYHNGADNDYPERVERVINNSVTAKLGANKMCEFLIGKGFGDELNKKVLGREGLYKTGKKLCRDVAYQNAIAIHINYDIKGVPNLLEAVPVKKVRISKEDDWKNKGKVYVQDDWKKESGFSISGSKSKKKWFYPYNPNVDVINAQRESDYKEYLEENKLSSLPIKEEVRLKLSGYRGQILYVNFEDENIYPNAWIDAAYNDADSEYRIGVFRNDNVRNGFRGSTIVTVAQSAEDSEAIVTKAQIKGLLGFENASNILLVEAKVGENGDIGKVVQVDQVKSEVNTEQFKYDEEKVQENILNCFKNIPKILVKNSDASLFGTSGEALKVAEEIYNKATSGIRKDIESILNEVLEKTGIKLKIIPLVDEEKETITNENIEDGSISDAA